MSSYQVITLLSYSIIPAAAIAVFKIRQCSTGYLPFFIYILLGFINEVISTVVIRFHQSNCINSNVFVLLDFWLVLLLFHTWQAGYRRKWVYFILAVLAFTLWIIEFAYINPFLQFNDLFRTVSAFIIVMLSGDQLSFLVIKDHLIYRNLRAIICIAFLIEYTYRTFTELLFWIDPGFSNQFYTFFLLIWSFVNAFVNLIYIPVLLWIPTKEKYYITYS